MESSRRHDALSTDMFERPATESMDCSVDKLPCEQGMTSTPKPDMRAFLEPAKQRDIISHRAKRRQRIDGGSWEIATVEMG